MEMAVNFNTNFNPDFNPDFSADFKSARPANLPLCPVAPAARIIGQKWTLQIVYFLLDGKSVRFCELQDALGGVNPSTLSSRLKMLEEEGLVRRNQVSAIPLHVEYSLTDMGCQLEPIIHEVIRWSNAWLSDRCDQECGQ